MGPPTNPATALPQKFLSLLRYNLFMGVNEMRVKILPLLCRSVETLHRTNWTNRPEILNKHRQKPMGKL